MIITWRKKKKEFSYTIYNLRNTYATIIENISSYNYINNNNNNSTVNGKK